MKAFKKAIQYCIFIFLMCIVFILFLPSRTPQIQGDNSVACIEKVYIGEMEQFIMVRGKDVSKPLLLFLHGGPGYPQISYARKYQEKLENEFIVVNWDQRGSGMSYSNDVPKNTMNREQFVKDTIELIDYLCNKYQKQKLFLSGHSWGTEIGICVIDEAPDKISAFISVGQVVNGTEGELISYDYTVEMATRENNQKALDELKKIGSPPYKDPVKDTLIQRKWLSKYNGVERKINSLSDIIWCSIFSPEYTGIDGIKFALGSKFTSDTMWGHNADLDFIKQVPKVAVPVYFCAGRYDYNTPFQLIEKYYNQIDAPYKELIWFEDSAHFPHFEQADQFFSLMKSVKEKNENRNIY